MSRSWSLVRNNIRASKNRFRLSWEVIAAFAVGAVSASVITALQLMLSPFNRALIS